MPAAVSSSISWFERAQLLFGGIAQQFGWYFLAFGLLLFLLNRTDPQGAKLLGTVFSGILVVAGLLLAAPGFVRGLKMQGLAAHGEIMQARVTKRTPARPDATFPGPYELVFEGSAKDGSYRKFTIKRRHDWTARDAMVVFDRSRPDAAILLHDLTGRPEPAEDGRIRLKSGRAGLLLAPTLVLLAIALNLLIR